MSTPERDPRAWHLLCPECEEEVVTMDGRVRYCGVCAGDVGRDVGMRRTRLYPADPLRQAVEAVVDERLARTLRPTYEDSPVDPVRARFKEMLKDPDRRPDGEVERLRAALQNVMVHTARNPGERNTELLNGLLDSVARIATSALNPETPNHEENS